VTIGANQFAIINLFLNALQRRRSTREVRDRTVLIVDMVEVHHVKGVGLATVHTGVRLFNLLDVIPITFSRPAIGLKSL